MGDQGRIRAPGRDGYQASRGIIRWKNACLKLKDAIWRLLASRIRVGDVTREILVGVAVAPPPRIFLGDFL
jgi:hypothetical protein